MENARGSSVEKGFADAAKTLSATYTLAYIQHTPMETRASVAEWKDDKLTVWAGVDNPPAAQRDLAQACSNEVVTQSDYIKARTALDRATGMTLENNNVILDDAFRGQITRPPSSLPAQTK